MAIQYKINVPAYAKGMVWAKDSVGWQAQLDKQGSLEIPPTATHLELTWGHAEGAPLNFWEPCPDHLTWEGAVRVWGHVNTSHLLTLDELDVMIIEIIGQAQPLPYSRLPSLADLRTAPHVQDNAIQQADHLYWYSFVLPLDSPLVDFANQSLVNGNALECYGTLAPQTMGVHQVVGMPFMLDSITLYGAT